jgi:hypothetical protein
MRALNQREQAASKPQEGMPDRGNHSETEPALFLRQAASFVNIYYPSVDANDSLTRRRADGYAPLAQMDRAPDYGSEGWEFESLRVHLQGS